MYCLSHFKWRFLVYIVCRNLDGINLCGCCAVQAALIALFNKDGVVVPPQPCTL